MARRKKRISEHTETLPRQGTKLWLIDAMKDGQQNDFNTKQEAACFKAIVSKLRNIYKRNISCEIEEIKGIYRVLILRY